MHDSDLKPFVPRPLHPNGTAEALGGGKFANGAVTGAYVMMFNHLMEPKPGDWIKNYVDDPIWDNFPQLDYTQLSDNERAQHIVDAVAYLGDIGKDPILPMHRIFSNLKNMSTLQNGGIKIQYAIINLDNRSFEVFMDFHIRPHLGKAEYSRNQTLFLLGAGTREEVLSRPGWHRTYNTGYFIGVNGLDSFNWLQNRLKW